MPIAVVVVEGVEGTPLPGVELGTISRSPESCSIDSVKLVKKNAGLVWPIICRGTLRAKTLGSLVYYINIKNDYTGLPGMNFSVSN